MPTIKLPTKDRSNNPEKIIATQSNNNEDMYWGTAQKKKIIL